MRKQKTVLCLLLAMLLAFTAGCASPAKESPYHVTFDVKQVTLSDEVAQKLLPHATEAGGAVATPLEFDTPADAAEYLNLELAANDTLTEAQPEEKTQLSVYSHEETLLVAILATSYELADKAGHVDLTTTIMLDESDKPDVPSYQSAYNAESGLLMTSYQGKQVKAYLGAYESNADEAVAEFTKDDIIYTLRVVTDGSGDAVAQAKALVDRF
ncbi:MAG: hypothetical protein EOM69_02670 [Clostridia bacterium]|nr:hypothetical protein [Clostridia bacterium]